MKQWFDFDELNFAYRFPFSSVSKKIIESAAISFTSVPEKPLKRAYNLSSQALRGSSYDPESDNTKILTDKDVLFDEVLAFPLSKLIVAVADRFEIKRKYLDFLSSYFFYSLSQLSSNKELVDLALDLKLDFSLVEGDNSEFFAFVSLPDFLRVEHPNPEAKLVNQSLDNGFVYFSRIGFARLIADIAVFDVQASFFKPSAVDPAVLRYADSLRKTFSESFAKFSAFSGPVRLEAFPPCMNKIHSGLFSGSNTPHMARFSFAAFLVSIRMPVEKIVDLFRKAPNFNEKITKYQVERISQKAYSCPSCDKMRSYGLCVANCPVYSPLEFYRKESEKN